MDQNRIQGLYPGILEGKRVEATCHKEFDGVSFANGFLDFNTGLCYFSNTRAC